MRVGFFILPAMVLFARSAVAAQCPTGFFLNENGECAYCNPGYEAYYCPGDDTMHECPWPDVDYGALFGGIIENGPNRWAQPYAGAPSHCVGQILVRTSTGQFVAECHFNGKNYYDACGGKYLWYSAATGYYLSGYSATSWHDWYNGVQPCTNAPENAHYTGPGTPDAKDGSVINANDCPWECDTGYAHSGNECRKLCTAGITKLHAGNNEINLYAVRPGTPALAVGFNGQTCYAPMYPGNARGLNIIYQGTNYHVAD